MGTPYVGEIRMFGGNFAPVGWAFCSGQLLSISEYDTLFTLIGTTYGGDGQNTFALPDLRGRIPLHQGQGPGLSNYVIGQSAGVEEVTLTTTQIPAHSHAARAVSGSGNAGSPANAVWAGASTVEIYKQAPATLNRTLNAAAVSVVGGSQPHDNMMPYLGVSFIISLFGLYPTPN